MSRIRTGSGQIEGRFERPQSYAQTYGRVRDLLEKHRDLLQSERGAQRLALLTMRVALLMGDPAEARRIGDRVGAHAAIREEPDFLWMEASAHFLLREYAAAEGPLLALFRSTRASDGQKAAAAYGLCGVYRKMGNVTEQLRFALWLYSRAKEKGVYVDVADNADLSVYWAASGWDLNLILDAEAPMEVLRAFVQANPGLANIRLVQYALAVRLTREERYEEAAEIYEAIHAIRRAPRLRQLAALQREAMRTDGTEGQRLEARYRLAEFLSAHPDGIYFNDALWHGLQRYALQSSSEFRLTGAERLALLEGERKLKDAQEERWRAYQILRGVMRDAGETEVGRKAAVLAIRCLRGISDRFGRQEEIRKADLELSARLRR